MEEKLNSSQKIARIVGVLFILATVLSLLSTTLLGPVIGASDYLVKVSENENQVIIGVILLLAAAVSVVLIPATLFPILRRYNEGIALGYLGFRVLEAITLTIDVVASLLLITLSREFINAGTPVDSYFQASGALLTGARDWTFPLNPLIFGPGSLMFNYLLYRSKLIPRWLSGWGLIGAALVTVFALLGLFGAGQARPVTGGFLILLAVPIGVQEMVFAVWLIVKGFNLSAIASPTSVIW